MSEGAWAVALAAELQVQASESDRRAATLDRLAAHLEQEAAHLCLQLDGVVAALTDSVWRGPAAHRTEADLRSGQRRLRAASDELRSIASLLRRRATDSRAEAADLRRRAAAASSAGPVLA